MDPLDWWLVGFGLRCFALLVCEAVTWLFVVPTLFNLHSDMFDAFAALIALAALVGGTIGTVVLMREVRPRIGETGDE